jgi:hypothetical protein
MNFAHVYRLCDYNKHFSLNCNLHIGENPLGKLAYFKLGKLSSKQKFIPKGDSAKCPSERCKRLNKWSMLEKKPCRTPACKANSLARLKCLHPAMVLRSSMPLRASELQA